MLLLTNKNPNSMVGDNCVILESIPQVPNDGVGIPTRKQCKEFDYIFMTQFCNIAHAHGIGRSKACNDFGGDRGRLTNDPDRLPREIMIKGRKRKYVLTSAVICYFCKLGIEDW